MARPVHARTLTFLVVFIIGGVGLVIWAGLLSAHRDRRAIIVISIGLAITGPVYESLLASTGAFHYTVTPLVWRIPGWLPALYLNAGVLATSAARAFAPQLARASAHTAAPVPSSPEV